MILELFWNIFRQLEEKKIDYLLSGSYAQNLYSVPRMTRDIDIVADLNENNLEDFFSIFSDEYYLNKEAIKQEVKMKRMFNIIHQNSAFKFDFILKGNDEFSKSMFTRKRFEKIDGFSAWAISPEDLFIAKLLWIQSTGSDFHLRDLKNMLDFPDLDIDYIKTWRKKLNLKTFDLFQ